MSSTHIHYITDNEQLQHSISQLSQSSFVAIDSEFVRRNTYKAILCLLQIADDRNQIYLIDALHVDLTHFWQWLSHSNITKVFHDSRQDLEIIWQNAGQLPNHVFDTQLAALMLGYGESCGYARLIETELGVIVDKDQTATDWCQRPLSDAQLAYAVNDVLYLAQVYPQLIQKLQDNERLHWIDSDNQTLSEVSLYEVNLDSLRKKLKAPPYFKAPQKQRLEQLLVWREQQALAENRPRQWVIDNKTLIQLADKAPKTLEQLSRLIDKPVAIRQYAAELLPLLSAPFVATINTEHKPCCSADALQQLQQRIDSIAQDFGLRQASVWLNRHELSQWISGNQIPARAQQGWRYALIQQHNLSEMVNELHLHG